MIYMGLVMVMTLVGQLISSRLKSKFNTYAQVPVASGLNGKEVAEEMLRHYGINDVKVLPSKGFLSDHYNPQNKTVNLSPDVYNGRSVAAAAVSAHECGHAIQHNVGYSMLKFRSAIVPIVSVVSRFQQWVLLGTFYITTQSAAFTPVFMVAIGIFMVTALFSFITLPVEFDASRRALVWLDESGVAQGAEYDGAKDALWWAAMTYVVAALTSLIMVLYLIIRFMGGSRN